MGLTLTGLGTVLLGRETAARAVQLHEESVALFRDLGDARGLATALVNLGQAHLRQGDIERAAVTGGEGLRLAAELGDCEQIATALELQAAVASAQGHAPRALRLGGAADRLRQEIGLPLSPAERSEFERALGPAAGEPSAPALRAAWNDGRGLTQDQAVAEALAGEAPVASDGHPDEDARGTKERDAPNGLTPRELDVLRLLVDGRTDREIADALFIGHRTVATHVMGILGKLGVDSRTAAATYAVRNGLV